jgi:predicted NBD/HSP70 family sugar kinase
MVVNPRDGRRCMCGSTGCLEAEAGERALLEEAGRPATETGRAAVRAVTQAAAFDARARHAVQVIGDWLGIGVANLINLFNPGVVIFGGMLQDVWPAAAEQVRRRIARNVLPVSRERVALRTCALGDDTTLIGAAELGFAGLLANPC